MHMFNFICMCTKKICSNICSNCLKNYVELKSLKEIIWRNHLRKIIWRELFERRIIWRERIIWEEKIIWEKKAEEKYLIRRDETKYWEDWDIKREQIEEFHWLKFLAFVPSVSIFCFVSSYQIFLSPSPPPQMILPALPSLKWSPFSNDPSQIIFLKWSPSNDPLK